VESHSPERQSGVERITNAAPIEEAEILQHFSQLFEYRPPRWFERDKTHSEYEIIGDVLVRIPEFVRDYGGVPVANVTPNSVRFLDASKLTDEQHNTFKGERGWYNLPDQTIVIYPTSSRLRTAEAIVHELMHLNSFASLSLVKDKKYPEELRIQADDNSLAVRRIGLSMFDGSGTIRYFRDLDEAIIEELTRRFDGRYFETIPALHDERAERENMRSRVEKEPGDIAAVATRQLEDGTWETEVFPYAYAKERARLNALVREIYERNTSEFASEEDVFKVFAGAVLSGRLLRLAKLIDKTFGKGTFQKLALETVQITPGSQSISGNGEGTT
jgi:hypothetical protein